MLLGWLRHDLNNQANQIAKVRPDDRQVYKAFDNLSEPFLIVDRSRVRTKLQVHVERSGHESTIRYAKFVQHIQDVMSLSEQYAIGGVDNFNLKEVMKVL